jgi:membrane protein implicated in regulation of membrane protease activity
MIMKVLTIIDLIGCALLVIGLALWWFTEFRWADLIVLSAILVIGMVAGIRLFRRPADKQSKISS